MVCTPGIGSGERVSTMVARLGKGLPMDWKVLRPMRMIWPVVIFLNHLKSSGRCQGILLPAPMMRLSDMAAMALKGFTALHSDRSLDAWVGVVAEQFKILVFEIVDIFYGGSLFLIWQRGGGPGGV